MREIHGGCSEGSSTYWYVARADSSHLRGVIRWLKEIEVERNAEEKRLLSYEQYKMVKKVAGRVIEELDAEGRWVRKQGNRCAGCCTGGLEPVSRM